VGIRQERMAVTCTAHRVKCNYWQIFMDREMLLLLLQCRSCCGGCCCCSRTWSRYRWVNLAIVSIHQSIVHRRRDAHAAPRKDQQWEMACDVPPCHCPVPPPWRRCVLNGVVSRRILSRRATGRGRRSLVFSDAVE
jgi:hypothetical protein